MIKYGDDDKIGLQILTDLHVSSPSEYKSGFRYVVCIYMCTSQVPQWLDWFIHLILKSLSIIGQCLVHMNISARKIGALHMGPTI
jgi:hypothetical protein